MSMPLYTAANGMQVQQLNMNVVANNLANVNTTGFKGARPEFQDLLYQNMRPAGANASTSTEIPTGIQIGLGSRLAATIRQHSQGSAQNTGQPLDVMIEGEGFFEITLPDGTSAYTRAGAFATDSTGRLVTVDGDPLASNITLPSDREEVIIATDGTVSVRQGGANTPTQVGTIQLVRFANPTGLEAIGHNLFRETDTSGSPTPGTASESGYGSLSQGFLELSNVDIVTELVNMIVGQRAYEVNSKAIQTTDEMLQTATQVKR
jgi:flagellar basal-body rod protein FlgG